MESLLSCHGLSKSYQVGKSLYVALKEINLDFPSHGFIAILGPSGCGKTTLLNILGGLDKPTSGEVFISGKPMKDFKGSDYDTYRNQRVGFIFQNYHLIPELTALSNVAIGLELAGVSLTSRKEKALAALDRVGLKDVANKKPNHLSGGQQQRVAIARAIANDPEIILADEPTGALDSEASNEVLKILKELSSDKLIIMVTHNEALAKEYAERIIKMKDGLIESDESAIIEKDRELIDKPSNKSSMGLFSAVSHSIKSLGSKKWRTALTAIASSFGIIGVALVLAVSNGLTEYIANIESSVASTVPVSVSPAVYDYASSNDGVTWTQYPDEENIYIYDNTSSNYLVHRNAYGPEYFNYLEGAIDKGLASSVLYNRSYFSFNLITKEGNTENYCLVDQYRSAGSTGSAVSSVTGLPATIFHELYGDEESLSSLYTTIYGRFPESYDEVVLVTDKYNRIEISTLERLGIISSDENYHNQDTISFSDIVYDYEGDTNYKEYKAYRVSDFYQLDSVDPQEITVTNAVEITALTPVDENGSEVAAASAHHIEVEANTTSKTLRYYEMPYSYGNKEDYKAIYNNDATYNPISLKIVGVLRPSEDSIINLMPASLAHTQALSNLLAEDVAEGGRGYPIASLAQENYFMSETNLATLRSYLSDPFNNIDSENIMSMMSSLLSSMYTYVYPHAYKGTVAGATTSPSNYMQLCRQVGGNFNNSDVTIDASDWVSILNRFLNPDFYNGVMSDYNLIDLIAFSNSGSLITSILIFPVNLSNKDDLLNYLDAYNEGKVDSEQIIYSDVMSSITDTISLITTVVPSVLIVFASISLVVSCVLMAIITYVSVLERSKEIGILRACGARKIDITNLFITECSLIGFISGLIGLFVAWVCCFPINALLVNLFPGYNLEGLASLNWMSLILVAIAIVLALLSGLIPALIAAKKDPVVVLRGE